MISEKSIQKIKIQISENMTKAFFNLIDENFNSDNPDYNWITNLYIEIRDRLCSYLNKNSKTYNKIHEDFDHELFKQMIQNKVFDSVSLFKLINNTFYWIEKLQAPCRDDFTIESKNKVLNTDQKNIISVFLKEVHLCLNNIDEDMNNYKNLSNL